MKVLRIINSLNIGGAEQSIVGNVPMHIKNGIEVDVLLLEGKETFFYNELVKSNVKIFSLNKDKSTIALYSPFHIFRLMKYMDKYDIIHVHLFPSIYWVGIAKVLKRSKSKFVLTEHQTYNRRRKYGWIFRKIDNFIYKQFDTIIAITPECKINLESHIGSSLDVKMIYNGIDLSSFENQIFENRIKFLPENINREGKVFITQVAGFRIEKDQKTVITALKFLPNNFYLVFVGDGETRMECEKFAESETVSDRVIFLGLRDDVPAILKSSDIVVMSSFYEGFGRAAVEGMAAGKPVLATNVAGLAQVVAETGLLFEVGDYKFLAELIGNVAVDKDLYRRLSDAGLRRAKDFDLNKMVENYEEVYNKLMQ